VSNAKPYVIVSPVRDEARFVEQTLRSVVTQTRVPALWVIVDDGSKDSTPEIIRHYASRHPFIRLITRERAGERRPGSGVVEAFNHGCRSIGDVPHTFIVKLDCDLSFEPDYFARLLQQFDANERLGIASGVYLERNSGREWTVVDMPRYHAFGACKVVRRQCFDEIGGFVCARGWDTVDEIRAMAKGWETRHFTDLRVLHLKPEGSGIGALKTCKMLGEIYYVTGGDPLLFAAKALRQIGMPPAIIGACALCWGFLSAALTRRPKLVTREEALYYRGLLRARLRERLGGLACL
jgi:glycosyltransferase involved in cell wall biosynthesis